MRLLLSCFLAWIVIGCAGCGKQPSSAARPPFIALANTHGTSMLPTFGEHEQVALELCAFDDLRARDTVIFWHEQAQMYVHHRLQYRDDTGHWVTQGDNNPAIDRGHMASDQFVGRTHKL